MVKMNKYTFDTRVEIVVRYLTDLFIEVEEDDEAFNNEKGIEGLLELKNEIGDQPLFVCDSDFIFDDESKEIMMEALKEAKKELNEYVDEGFISVEKKEAIDLFIKFVEETFNYGNKIRTGKVSFMTLPLSNGKSVLDNDIIGEPSEVVIDKKKSVVTPPHRHVFIGKGIDNKKVATNILNLLRYVEDALKYGDDFTKVAKTKGRIQSEGGTYVIRDLDEKIRIQLDRVRDRIIIAGIYYKESKGATSDKDQDVQEQYEIRKEIFKSIRTDDTNTLEAGEMSYRQFKQKLSILKYGNIIECINETKKLLVEAVKMKMQNELNG